VAYALSDGGTDWETWRFRRVQDGGDLPESLRFTKFWGVSWARDAAGVYYSRYPSLPNGKGNDEGRPAIYFHRLGELQERDRLIYAVTDHPTRVPSATVTEDGRFLVVTLFDGYEHNGVYLLDLRRPEAAARPLFAAWDALYTFIGSRGDELLFLTTRRAPNREVISINVSHPASLRTPSIIVPEWDAALEDARYVGGRVIARYVRDAHSVVRVFERNGRQVGEVPLPGLGSVGGFQGEGRQRQTFFSYTDYLTPSRIYRYDTRTNTARLWRQPRVASSSEAYVTEQVFFPSKDGTRVPMWITHRRDMARDGDQPLLLYGYGGFDISLTPQFSPAVMAWLELGGAYAVANLRGGGEEGESWHRAGMRGNKQNVFDDFHAAADWLVTNSWTTPAQLGISGGSNGGLLVGAALTQAPEKYAAVACSAPLLDMVRYEHFGLGQLWSEEYGTAEDPDELSWLLAYSPYHHVAEAVAYPAVLFTVFDSDTRVDPLHARKMCAALQAASTGPRPIVFRRESDVGHGARAVSRSVDLSADTLAFLAAHTGLAL
jgi:prolyl oligopeptidase